VRRGAALRPGSKGVMVMRDQPFVGKGVGAGETFTIGGGPQEPQWRKSRPGRVRLWRRAYSWRLAESGLQRQALPAQPSPGSRFRSGAPHLTWFGGERRCDVYSYPAAGSGPSRVGVGKRDRAARESPAA